MKTSGLCWVCVLHASGSCGCINAARCRKPLGLLFHPSGTEGNGYRRQLRPSEVITSTVAEAVERVIDAADSLREAGCSNGRSDAIIAANRIAWLAKELQAQKSHERPRRTKGPPADVLTQSVHRQRWIRRGLRDLLQADASTCRAATVRVGSSNGVVSGKRERRKDAANCMFLPA
jgi:hypothetical protein